MGTLTFSDLDVQLLPGSCGKVDYAIVTGRLHLARFTHGAAKKDDGIFSLLWRKDPSGWSSLLTTLAGVVCSTRPMRLFATPPA
jgi:hypothetical protein